MAILVDPFLLDYMAGHSGSCTFLLREVPDQAAAARGLKAAQRAVSAVPHPEEPDDPFVSWVSGLSTTDDGGSFTVDMADAEAYDGVLERVLDAVVEALETSGVDGGILTYQPVDEPLAAGPAERAAPSPLSSGRSAPGIPLPEPHKELWHSTTDDGATAGYFLPHEPEALMDFFDALPGVVLSFELHGTETGSYGFILIAMAGTLATITVRDAGEQRNVEMDLRTDPAKVPQLLAEARSQPLPPGAQVRIDRRR